MGRQPRVNQDWIRWVLAACGHPSVDRSALQTWRKSLFPEDLAKLSSFVAIRWRRELESFLWTGD